MKEYCIYIRQGSGMPYILKTYPDIISAKRAIDRLVGYEEERNRIYFVDNDYFYNKYCYSGNLKYMCIQVREVTEWEKYSEVNISIKNNNNIIYLKNYKKILDSIRYLWYLLIISTNNFIVALDGCRGIIPLYNIIYNIAQNQSSKIFRLFYSYCQKV